MNLSVIIPVLNEEKNVESLVARMSKALAGIQYELIFVDDHSTDNTVNALELLSYKYPVSNHIKQGRKGKAYSLLEGFKYAKYEVFCMIDADLQYPPEAIPYMLRRIESGADIVVSSREEQHTPILRKVASKASRFVLGKMLHGFDQDVQSGLKVFRREITERFSIDPSPWTFDLEFLIKARDAGYKIESEDIVFAKRVNGQTKIDVVKSSWEIGWSALKLRFKGSQIIPFGNAVAIAKGEGFHFKGKEYIHYSKLTPDETAFFRLDSPQKIILIEAFLIFAFALYLDWHLTIMITLMVLVTLYFIDLFFTLYSIANHYVVPAEVHITTKDLHAVKDREWPVYTILCPLYKEWRVIPQFVEAMNKLDYPQDKLQIMLLLEEDDKESLNHITDFDLPSYFQVVVVPDSKPKTKPKACNYGLSKATGEYIVIYDAEDIPDPYQLKKSVLAFETSESNVACVQAKLNFYNPTQNSLTRAFSAEYALWFDLVLPGLQSIKAPIPLGGTSNHFSINTLRLLKGWDSFNVTEDADLGTRLFKRGYQTIIVDSETLEEANPKLNNWMRQRSRWIKGYIQTWLVHMRKPQEFLLEGKKQHLITYQFVIIGKVMSMFINFFMWSTTIMYFAFRPELGKFIESFFPGPVLYMAVFCFVIGNFLYMYYYMIACMKYEHYELIKYIVLVPFYWLLMSFAAWKAVGEFIIAPHYWAKTQHGLLNRKGEDQKKAIIGMRDLAPAIVQ